MTATALIQLDNGQEQSCDGWRTVSASSVVQVVVTASRADPVARQDAVDLHASLQAVLRRSGARPEGLPCGGTFGPGVNGCWASNHAGAVRRVLIWVADRSCSPPAVPPGALAWSSVIVLLPTGAAIASVPPSVSRHVACHYAPGGVRARVPDVLLAAGIGSDSFRLFVSYRHDDCALFADQLFDGLSHSGFDVYLDRFRTGVGENFVDRINYELADKACVVLLDSEHVATSEWVAAEHAFARRFRLGLMAIDLPGGARSFPRIARRLDLRSGGISASSLKRSGLPARIDNAVDFIRAHYMAEMSRRPRYQRRIIQSASYTAGVPLSEHGDGSFETSVPGARKHYVISASVRPPGAEAFRRSHATGLSLGAKPVVVGPLEAHLRGGRQDADWLAGISGCAVVEETRLFKAMRHIGMGTL